MTALQMLKRLTILYDEETECDDIQLEKRMLCVKRNSTEKYFIKMALRLV